jgi:hypothetical protein
MSCRGGSGFVGGVLSGGFRGGDGRCANADEASNATTMIERSIGLIVRS